MSGRSCSFFLFGLAVIFIVHSASEFKAPPPWAALFLVVMLASFAVLRVRAFVVRSNMLRSITAKGGPEYESLGLQLLGDFPEYISAAAHRFAEVEERAAVPLILRKLEDLIMLRPAGWQDTADALLQALAQIKDRRALPYLKQLGRAGVSRMLPALPEVISSLEGHDALLRPADPDHTADLLRPVSAGDQSADSSTLLRATQESSETDFANLA